MSATEPPLGPLPTLALAAERVAPLAPRESRRANHRDVLRVAEYARLLDEGVDEATAGWKALSHPSLGIARWRGAPDGDRPNDMSIARKVASLLRRAAPELIDRARDVSLARVARLSDKALLTVDEVTSGNFDDAAKARVQLEGARTVLEATGMLSRSGARTEVHAVQSTQINQTMNVQHLTLGAAIRALKEIDVEAEAARAEPPTA